MKFKILVRNKRDGEWWENYDKVRGESNHIQSHGRQPEFTGDIDEWGRAIVAWFNKDEPEERQREFVRAESLEKAEAPNA